jgi:membrane-associated phospholipid phosphatase
MPAGSPRSRFTMNFLFDTQVNHFLQSFQTPSLTILMLAVSMFGSQPFLMLATAFIFFRVGWKKGFLFAQMLLWSFIVTDFFKELLYLPRPIQVDPSLLTFNEYLPRFVFESVGDNPGFPSGHVCSTVVFWGGVRLILPGRWQKIVGIALIVLMPFSRMYLGRHFLGDVIGGLLFGTLILLATFAPLIQSQRNQLFLQNYKTTMFIGYLLLPLILNTIPFFPASELGTLFGFNAAIFCFLSFDFFKNSASRITQFLTAILVFVLVNVALTKWNFILNRWIHFFTAAIPIYVALIVALITGKFSKRVGI